MADAKSVTKKIKDEEIQFVDLRFTDPRGKMQHVTMDSKIMDEEAFTDTTTGGTVEPGEEVTPEPDGGILSPSPIGSATPEPSDGTEPLWR